MRVLHTRKTRPTGEKLAALLADHPSEQVLNWGTHDPAATINKSEAVMLGGHKRLSRERFVEVGVPAPNYYTAESVSRTTEYPLVGRPDHHSKGKNFFLCANADQVRRAIFHGATHFTEFVELPHEFRAHVFNGQVIKFSEKLGGTGYIKNRKNGWRFMKPTIESRERCRIAAKKAVAALGLDFGAVDLAYDSHTKRVVVFEVNTAPALFETTLGIYVQKIKENYPV